MGLAVGFLFARRRAMPGVAALRHERLATDFAASALDPTSTPRNPNRAIDSDATFDAANNMRRHFPTPIADDGPTACLARLGRAPPTPRERVYLWDALGADFGDVAKDQIVYGRIFQTVDDVRDAVRAFAARYNAGWLIEKNGHRSPDDARAAWHDQPFRRAA